MQGVKKVLVLLVFLLAAGFLFGYADKAQAAATISGKVTKSDGVTPIESMQVIASKGAWADDDYTDSNGDYSISVAPTDASLIDGTYTVKTSYYGIAYEISGGSNTYSVLYYPQTTTAAVTNPNTSTVNFSLIQRAGLTGTVTNSVTGAAVSNTYVYMWNQQGSNRGSGSDYSSTSGRYSLYSLPSTIYDIEHTPAVGVYDVYISASGYIAKYVRNVNLASDDTTSSLNISLAPQSYITGRVTNSSGANVGGVGVEVYQTRNSGASYYVATASDGTYTVAVDDGYFGVYGTTETTVGEYRVLIRGNRLNNYVNQSRRVQIASDGSTVADVNFTLTEAGTLSGRVTRADGSTAIEEAKVEISNADQVETTYTASDGTYSFIGLKPASDYVMTVTKSGYVSAKSYNVVITAGGVVSDQNYSLVARDSSLSGKIYETDGTTPVANARVRALCKEEGLSSDAYSDSNGDYKIDSLRAGQYTMTLSKNGYITKTVTPVAISGAVTANYNVVKEGVIIGTVTSSSGGTLSYVSVNVYWGGNWVYGGTTDNQGVYRITSVGAEDNYIIVFSKDGYVTKTVYNVAATAGGVTTKNVTIAVADSSLSGRIYYKQGSTKHYLRNVTVIAYLRTDDTVSGTTTTDESGRYTIANLQTGDYKIVASKGGYVTKEISKYNIENAKTKDIAMAKAAKIYGRVIGSDKKPISGAYVEVKTSVKYNGSLAAFTDRDGYYQVSAIPGGKAKIRVTADWRARKVVTKTLKAGKSYGKVNFKLGKAGTVAGYVKDDKGFPVSATVRVVGTDLYDWTDSAGYFEVTNVPTGKKVAYVFDSDWYTASKKKSVTVKSGKTSKSINLTVTDKGRKGK